MFGGCDPRDNDDVRDRDARERDRDDDDGGPHLGRGPSSHEEVDPRDRGNELRRDVAVVLTKLGRDLLEHHRDRDADTRQELYAGLKRERELEHDVQVYDAYLSAAERLEARDAHIDRIVLDYELKRDYQRWLHERDRDHDAYDGHPDRDAREIEAWALEHDLPYFDEQVHFPDLRIEYEELDGRHRHEDLEVITVHYRGTHGAAAARSGFTAYRGFSVRIGGRSGGGGRGGGRSGGLSEELLR